MSYVVYSIYYYYLLFGFHLVFGPYFFLSWFFPPILFSLSLLLSLIFFISAVDVVGFLFLCFFSVCTRKHALKLDHFRLKLYSRKSNKRHAKKRVVAQQHRRSSFCYSLLSNLDFVYTFFSIFLSFFFFFLLATHFSTSFLILSAFAQ